MRNLGQIAQQHVPQQNIQNRDYYAFKGGLNLVDPFLSIAPGQLLATMNYEVFFRGGYRRVAGYERFDGRPRPHRASYITLTVVGAIEANKPEVGQVIDWGTGSGAIIYMIGDAVVVGDYDGDEPVANQNLTGPNGAYALIEQVLIEDTLIDEENIVAMQASQEARRAVIEAVPGTGPIRGVVLYNERVYAFRDNAGETACIMWRSSPDGWEQVTFSEILRFENGGDDGTPVPDEEDGPPDPFSAGQELFEGDEITGATSGAEATVVRLRQKSGFWSNKTAEGYLILKDRTGTFEVGEGLLVDGEKVAEVSEAVFVPSLPPGGQFDFRIYTFSRSQVSPRLYGVSGTTWAWEYDSYNEFFAPIETGMDPDTPNHLACHNRMLFLSFTGGSIQNSNPNDPMRWTLAGGADEQMAGGEVTGFLEEISSALLIYTRDSVEVLYGAVSTEFELVNLNREIGGIERTMQRIGMTVHLDQRGFASVVHSERYGNFETSNLSQLIQPVLANRMGDIFGSQIVRSLNLYRLFMKDGSAFVLGFHGNEPAGFTMIDYGRPITALWSSQTEGNRERLFFGSDNGMVYEQDVGTNFDGEPIEAFALMVFYHSGAPEQIKRYRKAVLEMSGFQASIMGSIDVNYGGTGETGAVPQEIGVSAGGSFWDVGRWSQFKWSDGVGADPSFYIEDSGFNIGLHLYHNSAVESPHVLHGINITWSPRRLKREY